MLHALHPIVSTLATLDSVLHLVPRKCFILHIKPKTGKSAEIRFGKEQHWKCFDLVYKTWKVKCRVCVFVCGVGGLR